MRSKSGSFKCMISSVTPAGPLGNREHLSRYGSTAIGKKRSLFAKRSTGSYFSSNSRSFTWPQLWYKRDMNGQALEASFGAYFNAKPEFVVRAPGRVNLIGEHTDYNDGFVLPMAIDRRSFVAAAPRDDKTIRAISTNEGGRIEFEIGREYSSGYKWGKYVYGMAECLRREEFDPRGADLLIASEVPIGAGLSSSAALEISTGLALLGVSGQIADPVDLALMAQRAEREFAGISCGVMDQYIACLGIEGYAMMIDCRSLEYRAAPIDMERARVVVCDSGVKHNLAAGEYNRRRAECEDGVSRLSKYLPDIQALRDVDIDDFDHYAGALPETVR